MSDKYDRVFPQFLKRNISEVYTPDLEDSTVTVGLNVQQRETHTDRRKVEFLSLECDINKLTHNNFEFHISFQVTFQKKEQAVF